MPASGRVTQSLEGKPYELTIRKEGKTTKVKILYDSDGLLTDLTLTGAPLPLNELQPFLGNIVQRVQVIEEQPHDEYLSWLNWNQDGVYIDGWSDKDLFQESVFSKIRYHGRMGAYYMDEVGLPMEKWTLPRIASNDNGYEEGPWRNAVIVSNRNPTTNALTQLYVGMSRPHFNMVFCFWACLPAAAANVDDLYIGFEPTSAGAFGLINALHADGAAGWRLRAVNYSGIRTEDVALNNAGVYARYALIKDEWNQQLRLFQAPAADPAGFPLVLTDTLSLATGAPAPLPTEAIMGKCIPFFANEYTGGELEFRIGRFWIYELNLPSAVLNPAPINLVQVDSIEVPHDAQHTNAHIVTP